jgi:hypothetical protein
MKEAYHIPLDMTYAALREYEMNIEEANRNPGQHSEEDEVQGKARKSRSEKIAKSREALNTIKIKIRILSYRAHTHTSLLFLWNQRAYRDQVLQEE